MEIKRYNSNGRFHEAVTFGETLYLCGKCADGADITEQAKACLADLEATLEKYGSDKTRILSATVYLKDMSDFGGFNAVWDAWFEEGTQPIRTCVEAALAATKFLVEITLIAALK